MRKFKPRQPRSLLFRLLALAASGLLFTAAFVPGAKATLLVYFNFEDGQIAPPNTIDTASDEIAAAGGDNPGGGIQHSTWFTDYPAGDDFTTASAIQIGGANRSAGDIDVPPLTPGLAVGFNSSLSNNGTFWQFGVGGTFFQNMSLSYACNTNGNGFTTQTWSYSTNGGVSFTQFAQFTGLTGLQVLSAALPTGANNQGMLVIRVTFTGGQSNGNDLQTIIDNIQLNGTVIPEPTTIAGGLLGVLGLCWFQRRRLRLILPRSRRA
jgi:hypothetical protein